MAASEHVRNSYNNAFIESYFSGFKAGLLQGGTFESLEDARTKIFEYIEMYYTPICRRSALGYTSPATFEQRILPSKKGGRVLASKQYDTFLTKLTA